MPASSPDFLPKVMDLLLDAVCVVDAEGRFVFVNAACERLFGYSREELVGRNMLELVHPDDRERTLAAAENVMRGRPHLHFENRYLRKDGEVVDVMWSARWSENDRLRLAVARNITELKRAERKQQAIYRISEAAHAADSLPALYEHIHRIIDDLLPADNFYVALHDTAAGTITFPYYVDERERVSPEDPRVNESPLAEVVRTGGALLITVNDSTAAEPDRGDWLGAPLVSQHGTVMGALVVQSYTGEVRYTGEDRELLQFVSTQIASAIERKQSESRLFYMARHDPLTDLPNRSLFYDRFESGIRRARRDGERLALLYLDLDDFKSVNDGFGHVAGDQLLQALARRLTGCIRESDTVGRMGGDEFTILLTNIGRPEDVDIIVDKILAAVSEPFDLDGSPLTISTSIGTAVYPEHGEGMEELLRHADAVMYSSKARAAGEA